MNHPDFTELRRCIDEAITFNDLIRARTLSLEGLQIAEEKERAGEVCFFRAQLSIIEGKFEEAVPYLRQALVHNPLDGAAYNDLALCAVESGKIDGVLEIFDQGIAVEPDYATIHHNKGWFLNKLGLHHEALACFQKALELEPRRAVTFENMADVFEHLGEIAKALAAYKMALALIKAPFSQIRVQVEGEIRRLESA
ncbi:MAG: tetratricopeptide repeat protein [Candidatus Omnitrophica bacterium]|nr:tetratricopeptide repeat protein [Candidatus Omnitrophota bacterium]